MKKRYLLIGITILLFIFAYGYYNKKYQFQGRNIIKSGLINDMTVLKSIIQKENISNYQIYFDDLKKEQKIISISLIFNKLVNKNLENRIKDKFILDGYSRKCFYFMLKSNELGGNEKYLYNYFKDKYFQKCSNKECYIIFTEKGLLKSDDLYNCN